MIAMGTGSSSLARRVAAACAGGAVLLGVLALVGWGLGLPALTQVSPVYRAIAPSAAGALLVLGTILLWLVLERLSRSARALLGVVAGLVALYGLLDLVGFLAGADPNREDALTAFLAKAWSIPLQPMSPTAAVLMFLVGAAVVALLARPCVEGEHLRLGSLAGALGAAAAGGALVFVLSYVHGVPLLYGSNALPIAATSALGFVLLGAAVVAVAGPACWPLRPLSGDSVRARLLRAVVPLTVLAVLVSMVAHEEVPAFVSVNRALQTSLLAVVFASLAGLVASRVAAIVGHALDAAQAAQQEAQQALRQSEQRWATTLASIGDAVIATDTAGRITFMNHTAESATGWTLQEALSRPVTEVFHIVNEYAREEVECPVPRVLREGVVVGLANRTLLVRRDGTEVPIDDSGAPIVAETGQVTGVVLVFHDITARREAERALRESEGRYRSLFENMLDGFAYCRMLYGDGAPQDFVYLDVNSAFARLTGLKDVVGRKVSEVIPGIREANPELFEICGRVARSGEPERFEVYLEPLQIWLSVAVYSPERDHFVAVFDNITARKQAEEALRESEELLRVLVNGIPDPAYIKDRESRIVMANPALAEVVGRPLEEIIGRTDAEYYRNAETGRVLREHDLSVMASGGSMVVEETVPTPRGPRTFLSTKAPRRDTQGRTIGVVGVSRDITDRKQAEERALAAERARAEIAEHVGDEIAHRVKNNLAMVSGLLHMQMLSEPNPEAADAMRDAIGRIRTFVTLHEQMYASHAEEADLLVALQRIGTTIEELFAEKGGVAVSVRGEPVWCSARVATNLSVIANELITNALKHGGPGADGRRTVAVDLHRTGEDITLAVWNSGALVPGDLDPARSRTMGLRLVHDIVVGQYRGRFHVRPSEEGTLAEVVVPGEAIRADSLPR